MTGQPMRITVLATIIRLMVVQGQDILFENAAGNDRFSLLTAEQSAGTRKFIVHRPSPHPI